MTNPTESLVARLRAFDEERFYQEPATAYATMQEAAERLSTLEAALTEAQKLNNKYAWERDKAREERDTAERRSEAFWKDHATKTALSNEPGK